MATMSQFRASDQPGAYCKVARLDDDGVTVGWWARCGRGHAAQLADHEVTEHDDGTISVSPSIICPHPGCHWHAILEHGIWRLQ